MSKYGINKVILVGNLGKDPEVRHLESGAAVASFTLATTESYRNKEGATVDKTEWHNIVMWRGLAEVAGKYLKKGSTIYVEGRITTRSWDDPDGTKKYRTEVEVQNMVMLDSRNAGGATGFESGPVAYSGVQTSNPVNQGGNGGSNQPVISNPPKPGDEDPADDLPF